MRCLEDIQRDILEAKAVKKQMKKEYGKHSVEFAEAKEEVDQLLDEYEFSELHL